MSSLKEFQDKTNALIASFADDGSTTSGSLNWTKDEIQYYLSISINGGSINSSFSAYKPTPTLPETIPETSK